MKFKLNEHPSVLLFLISLVVLGISIVIAWLYQWSWYADIAIVIAVLAVAVLGYTMVKDLLMFDKQRGDYYEKHKGEPLFDEKEEKEDDDWDKD